jgi:hypothetical protein
MYTSWRMREPVIFGFYACLSRDGLYPEDFKEIDRRY